MGPTGPKIFVTGYSTTSIDLSVVTLGDTLSFTVFPENLEYNNGSYLKLCATGTSYEYLQGTATYYSQNTLDVKVDYIYGAGTYDRWNIGIGGREGPQGIQGEIGPDGAVGTVPDGYFVLAEETEASTGVLYQTIDTDDFLGVNNLTPTEQLDVSGRIRARTIDEGVDNGLTSGHVVVDPESGILNYIVPKIESQLIVGNYPQDTFTLNSPCRGPEFLLLWDVDNLTLLSPGSVTVNGTDLIFDQSAIPYGNIELRHIIL